MEYTEIAVIGAGLLGCFAAQALAALDVSVIVLEVQEDVCTGISRVNASTGYDTKPGTFKMKLCVRANQNFDCLCRELEVPFSWPGSLRLSFGPWADKRLHDKFIQGQTNGVPDLALLTPAEAHALEPISALVSPGGFMRPVPG